MAETETLGNSSHLGVEETADRNAGRVSSDAQNPSDSSSSDSDSDSDSEAQARTQIEALEKELHNNPSNYDSHVQYIKILRKQGDIEKLSQARKAMCALFPLNPEMWQEWAKDETTIRSVEEILPVVAKLYERGVSEYLSVALWCDYLHFLQEFDVSIRECSTDGISKARNFFERALTAAGLHVCDGHLIWELYREFEEAVLLTIEESDTLVKEKQVQRVRSLFHRQLSVPLSNHRSTLLAYRAWEANQGSSFDINSSELDGLSSHVVSSYQKALEMLNARVHLEEQISGKSVDHKNLQEYMTYLKFECSFGDPARIQVLYERAIAEFPISSDLWLEYTQYLDKTFKTSRIVRDTHYRATRNCPWVGELWIRYLLCVERSHGSEEELSSVFEKSLLCTFTSFDEYLNIFLTRVDGLRRKLTMPSQLENGLEFSLIRNIFQRASDYLSIHLKNTESLLHMYSYWARLELKLGNDLTAARGIWESLLKISGSMLEVWQRYVAMEIEMGHINEARSLYKRCYSKRFLGAGSVDICHSWVRFEREYGSLEHFDIAMQKVTPRLQELQLFSFQQESKNTGVTSDERENLSRKNVREKRKPVSSLIEEQPPLKHRKEDGPNRKKIENYKENEVSAEAIIADVKKKINCSSKEPVAFDDKCTAFLSNLNFETTAEDLHHFFGADGGAVDIRILVDKFTKKSRGLAYVDFSDDKHLSAAVEKNRQTLLGKRISIVKSDPQQGRKKGTVGHSKSVHGNPRNPSSPISKLDLKGNRASLSQSASKRHENDIQLVGRNTFAMPRNLKALDSITIQSKPQSGEGSGDETPKSNDEFRKMFLKS